MMTMRHFRLFSISLFLVGAGVASAQSLGVASSYNVFTLGDFTGTNSDVEGRLAAGGNVSLTNYDVGLRQAGSTVLVAGGNLQVNGGSIRGTAIHGGTANLQNVGFPNGGLAQQGTPIDFNAARTFAHANSAFWGGFASTGTAAQQFSSLNLTGSRAGLNVFDISASQLQDISEVNFNLPTGATALVNVSGVQVTFGNIGYNFNGSQSNGAFQRVMWNLKDATGVSMNSLRGSVYAPKAAVNGGFGDLNGQLVAASFTGSLQFNENSFTGELAPVPEPMTMSLLALGLAAVARKRRKAN